MEDAYLKAALMSTEQLSSYDEMKKLSPPSSGALNPPSPNPPLPPQSDEVDIQTLKEVVAAQRPSIDNKLPKLATRLSQSEDGADNRPTPDDGAGPPVSNTQSDQGPRATQPQTDPRSGQVGPGKLGTLNDLAAQ